MDSTTSDTDKLRSVAKKALNNGDRSGFRQSLKQLNDPSSIDRLARDVAERDVDWAAECLFEHTNRPSDHAVTGAQAGSEAIIQAAIEQGTPLGPAFQEAVKSRQLDVLVQFAETLTHDQPPVSASGFARTVTETLNDQQLVELAEYWSSSDEPAIMDVLLTVLSQSDQKQTVRAILESQAPTDHCHDWYQAVADEHWASLIAKHARQTAAPHRDHVLTDALIGLLRIGTTDWSLFRQILDQQNIAKIPDPQRTSIYRAILAHYDKQLDPCIELFKGYIKPITSSNTGKDSLLVNMVSEAAQGEFPVSRATALGEYFGFPRDEYERALNTLARNHAETIPDLLQTRPDLKGDIHYETSSHLHLGHLLNYLPDHADALGVFASYTSDSSTKAILKDLTDQQIDPDHFRSVLQVLDGQERVVSPVGAYAIKKRRAEYADVLCDEHLEPGTLLSEDLSDGQRAGYYHAAGMQKLLQNLRYFFEHFDVTDDQSIQTLFENVIITGVGNIGEGYDGSDGQQTINVLDFLRHDRELEPSDFDNLYRVLCYRNPVVPSLLKYLLQWEIPSREAAREIFINTDTSAYEEYDSVFRRELSDRQLKFLRTG